MQGLSSPAEPAYRLLFESLSGYFLAISPQLTVLAASNTFIVKTGLPKNAVLGKPIMSLYTHWVPAAAAGHICEWENALAYLQTNQASFTMAEQHPPFFGAAPAPAKHWQLVNTPVYAATGELIYIIHEVKDITAQYLANEKARQSEERFNMVALATNDAVWDWNLQNNTITWNEGYKSLFGFAEINASLNSRYDSIHPDDRERIIAGINQAIANNQHFWYDEYRFRCADGSYSDIVDRGYVLYNTAGAAYRMVGSMQDITLSKKAEQQQKETAQFFRFLADTVPAFIWTSNPDGSTDYRNQYYYDFVGLDTTRQPGFSWTDVLHPDDREESLQQWLHAVKTGELFEIEHRLRAKTGKYHWILSRARAMRDEQGHIIKWFGSSTDIEAQKKYQQELQAREAWLQRLLTDAPVLFCVLRGPDLVCTFINPNLEHFYSKRAYIGLAAREAWPELADQNFISILNNVYTTGQPFVANEFLLNIKKQDNEHLQASYLNISVQPLRDANNLVEGVLFFGVDVTGQVVAKNQAEMLASKIRHETEKFKLLSEAVPQLVWTARPDGLIDYLNQQWITYTGIPWEESRGSGLLEVLHPDDYEFTMQLWRESLATGKPLELEYRLRNAAGQYRWHLVRGLALKNEEGRIIKWCGTCTDIHDQKYIQQKLQESNDRFRFLAESIPQKVWTAKPNGEIDYYNQQWLQFTGLTFEELKDWGWEKIIHPDDLNDTTRFWQKSLATATDFQMENRLRQADGTYRWHLTRGLPMHNEQGLLTMWVGTNTDINEQKVNQENLQEANAELKRINEDLDRFVYTASHDLKLPIINMGSLFGEIIRSSEFTDPDHNKLVELFYKSLDQINATISDLLEITKVQKNINAEKEKVDLQQLTNEICLSIQDLVQNSQARIFTDFAPIPYLEFSKANLRSILYNLISNAIKYRSPHRPPDIYISTAMAGDFNVLTVKDNGLGINLARHKDKLFQMFKRFHSHVPGTGLGLYMVNRIMQNNNGYIEVDSNLDTGSTFRIYFRKD